MRKRRIYMEKADQSGHAKRGECVFVRITNIQYLSQPENPWIVMIHGFGGSRGMWNKQIEAFKQSYNLLIVELPGHGDSEEGMAQHKDSQMQDVAEAIIEMLHEQGIRSAIFICVSL